MSLQPLISVVIPTRNRNDSLRQVLEGLRYQTLPKTDFTIIVIDDASNVPADNLKEDYQNVSFIRLPTHTGPSGARNVGLFRAQTHRVLFLDGDMMPHPSLLENHLKAANVGEVVIGYRFNLNNFNSKYAILNQDMTPDPREEDYTINTCNLSSWHIPWYVCQSNNFSASTNLLKDIGGFDEKFADWGCEDLELGYRLQHKKAIFTLARNAIAYHIPHNRDTKEEKESDLKNLQLFLDKHRTYDIELWSANKKKKLKENFQLHKTISMIEQTSHGWMSDWSTEQDLPQMPGSCAFLCAGSHLSSFNENYIFHPLLTSEKNRISLLGVDLPFPADSFEAVVLSSLCLILSDLTHSILTEAQRIAPLVYFNIPEVFISKTKEMAQLLNIKLRHNEDDQRLWLIER